MADGRANNGGHSTKSKKAVDKRKNQNMKLVEKFVEEDFDYTKFKKLMNKLYSDGLAGDVKSALLFLQYVVGKPKERIDITNRN